LLFPAGKLYGIWTWEEVRFALFMGAKVIEWGKSIWFEGKPIFRDFVLELYKYRDKSSRDYDEGLAVIAKLLMNSLYGKTGQKTKRKRLISIEDNPPIGAKPLDGTPESPLWVIEEETDACYIMPQLAAYVTAYSRVLLLQYMLQASKNHGIVYYCDTDSIITSSDMPTGSKLGELKIEHYSESFVGIGPKMYSIGDKVVAKGFEGSHRNVECLNRLVKGESLWGKRLQKLGSVAKDPTEYPKVIDYHKSIRMINDKRDFPFKGGMSKPLIINMKNEIKG
jgi:hypothetical protein